MDAMREFDESLDAGSMGLIRRGYGAQSTVDTSCVQPANYFTLPVNVSVSCCWIIVVELARRALWVT